MSGMIREGETVAVGAAAAPCTVEGLIGCGGQGEVYHARLDGTRVALKWYFPQLATNVQRSALELLVRMGAPTPSFLWPIDLAVSSRLSGFGYVMPLREPNYAGLKDMFLPAHHPRRADPPFRTLTSVGFELADNFQRLHARGLCYRDINFENVFFLPDSGRVLICDNDNVGINGQAAATVRGTPRFMAPEIVRGESLPNADTDLHSLAVLLFYMFMMHHPLEGKREASIRSFDLPAMTYLYGTDALFIYDPTDSSNAPVPGYQDNALRYWPIYPGFLRDLFTQAFTSGMRDPAHGRVRETVWRAAMVRLRDAIFHCGHCGVETFFDDTAPAASSECWNCREPVQPPLRLRIGGRTLMVNSDTRIYPHHVDDQRLYDFSQPVGAVTQHPTIEGVWGLRNSSDAGWDATLPDGRSVRVEVGQNVTLRPGVKVQFGARLGELLGQDDL